MSYSLVLAGTGFASSFFLKRYLEKAPPTAKVLVLEGSAYTPHKEKVQRAREIPYGDTSYISNGSVGNLTYDNATPSKPWIFSPGLGGGSNCWTGCTPRFLPNDFMLQSRFNVGIDWPIRYEEIEPYYCEAEEIMAISGPERTPYQMSKPYPQPPHALSTVDKLMQKEYGDLYISQPSARSSIQGKRNRCCTSAICHLCPVDAKFTIENGLMDVYQDPRVEVSYLSRVFRLETSNDRIRAVEYRKDDKDYKVEAEAFALGTNAIFNAHILLNSGDTNKHTGHYLSEQIGYYAYAYLDGMDNVGGSSAITANGFMLYDTVDRSKMAACILESHNDPFVRHEHGKWRAIAKFKFVFEDLASYDNTVKTTGDILRPQTSWTAVSDYVKAGYENLKANIDKVFSPLPIESIYLNENPQPSEAHIMGTTRMGKTAEEGVIDKNQIHHQYRNLFVLGSGGFPTQSPANPTLTLAALSLMSVDNSF